MINFNIPPKPGAVVLDDRKLMDLLDLRGHTQRREALLAGAGYAIGALLMQECETIEDATEIVGELSMQATEAFNLYNQTFDPGRVNAVHLASILEYGMEQGRITTSVEVV